MIILLLPFNAHEAHPIIRPGERNCTLVQVAFERDGIATADSAAPDNPASSLSLDEEACAAALPQAITLA
ncbi:MAG: hypothetical protein ABI167_08930 [Nitrosospira sp.]